MSPSLCTCGAVLDITVWHGDDELGNPLCPTCSGCGCEPNERNERVSVPTDTPSTDGAPDPEPAPLVVTCNGHSIELSDEEARAFVQEWDLHGDREDFFMLSNHDLACDALAGLLRDARQDPQPTADTPSDDIDFDAMPIGTVLWDDSDFLLRFPGGWSYNPPADEDDYYDIDADNDKFTLVYQPAPVSPSEGLRAVLAGRDDADELIEYAATSYRSDRVLGPGRHLLSAVGDAARSGGAT